MASDPRERHIAGGQREAEHANGYHDGPVEPGDVLGETCLHDQRGAAERHQPKPDRKRGKQDHLRHLSGGKAPAGVEAVTDRAGAQGRKPDVMADRERHERGERRFAIREGCRT